jgi:cell division protein FtsB
MIQLFSLILSLFRPGRLIRWGIFLAGLVFVWGVINFHKIQAYFAAHERRNNHLEAVAELKKERDRLTREQTALEAGGFPAEKAIRERFIMVRPGEKILFVETPIPKGQNPKEGQTQAPPPLGLASDATTTSPTPEVIAPKQPKPTPTPKATPKPRKSQKQKKRNAPALPTPAEPSEEP